jgi:DNA-binding CsgD family transcriptional regulator
MGEQMGIGEADLRRLLHVVDPARCTQDAGTSGRADGDELPGSVLRDIADLVACDCATFQVMDPYRREITVQYADPGTAGDESEDPELTDLWWPAMWEHCSYPQRSGDYQTVTRGSDELPGVRSGPHWQAYVDGLQVPMDARGRPRLREVMVTLPPTGVVDRRLLLWREDGSDFSDRDVLLLTLLRPHVVALNQRHRLRATGAAELTTRQWEILRLVAAGCSNAQIARALTLSEATVRKHLENIYSRLNVNSRTEALAKADLTRVPA